MASLALRNSPIPPQRIKVLVTGKLHPIAHNLLLSPPAALEPPVPLDVVVRADCSREDLLSEVATSHVLISRSETDVDAPVLNNAPYLSVVARAAVGIGNIDCSLATSLGILVVNTPGKNTNSAAELTFGLLLNALRHIHRAHPSTAQGGWNRHAFTGSELQGKTLGIVGLGNVGHRVAQFARGFDMEVLAYDPYISEGAFRKHKAQPVASLDALLPRCHVLSVHVPLNGETRGMIGARELALLPRGAIVLNAARGGVVDEEALLGALESGQVGAAGIDTWEREPQPWEPLRAHPRVVATPHIGASTLEAQERIGEAVALQVLKALRGEIVEHPVNLPNVGVLTLEKERLMAVLAEKLGSFASQILTFQPSLITLQGGNGPNDPMAPALELAALKGFLSRTADGGYVSYVNAHSVAKARGLRVEWVAGDTAGQLVVRVEGAGAQEEVVVGGALYNDSLLRITQVNGFVFEAEPQGDFLVLENHDRPGVIGGVGGYLARYQVNIGQFELSRNRPGGMAMALIKVDSPLTPAQVAGLAQVPHIISVRPVGGL